MGWSLTVLIMDIVVLQEGAKSNGRSKVFTWCMKFSAGRLSLQIRPPFCRDWRFSLRKILAQSSLYPPIISTPTGLVPMSCSRTTANGIAAFASRIPTEDWGSNSCQGSSKWVKYCWKTLNMWKSPRFTNVIAFNSTVFLVCPLFIYRCATAFMNKVDKHYFKCAMFLLSCAWVNVLALIEHSC